MTYIYFSQTERETERQRSIINEQNIKVNVRWKEIQWTNRDDENKNAQKMTYEWRDRKKESSITKVLSTLLKKYTKQIQMIKIIIIRRWETDRQLQLLRTLEWEWERVGIQRDSIFNKQTIEEKDTQNTKQRETNIDDRKNNN